MLYHQEKTYFNTKGYHNMRESIRMAYEELEEIGWTQVISDQEEEGEESANSEEAPGFIAAITNLEDNRERGRHPKREDRDEPGTERSHISIY
eukprot:282493-Heterocapsa_arctica.AAC.1